MESPIRKASSSGIAVDMVPVGRTIGRIKSPPICVDATIKGEGMTTEELSKLSFALKIPRKSSICSEVEYEPSIVSSSSSTASRESALSDQECKHVPSTPLRLERRQSCQINLKVTNQKISRSGRQSQRWLKDPSSKRMYRMVTGCVPIVEGGRVLFVSASRKPEWILPKGGWEKDEAMEESAIRECFEEAGVLGVLGPRLNDFDYETRKAKKRRLQFEEHQRKRFCPESTSKTNEIEISSPLNGHLSKDKERSTSKSPVQKGIGGFQQIDETSSVASDASISHTHVRLSLFVLYVSEVKSTWPESGRSRKVVDIDEAIRMCESRPEFLAALKEVRERNLQHLPDDEICKPSER